MVKTKNGINKIFAFVLILTLAVTSLLLVIPKNSKRVYASGIDFMTLYEQNTLFTNNEVVKKNQEELISDGDISVNNNSIVINNKDLEGDLMIEISGFEGFNFSGLFENCSKLTAVNIYFKEMNSVELEKFFYGCSSLKRVWFLCDETLIDTNTNTKDMFKACGKLEYIDIDCITGKTFSDLGLEYARYESENDSTNYVSTDIVQNEDFKLFDYLGSTQSPDLLSTGVVNNMLGLVVTSILVIAICYVASKKTKV